MQKVKPLRNKRPKTFADAKYMMEKLILCIFD